MPGTTGLDLNTLNRELTLHACACLLSSQATSHSPLLSSQATSRSPLTPGVRNKKSLQYVRWHAASQTRVRLLFYSRNNTHRRLLLRL